MTNQPVRRAITRHEAIKVLVGVLTRHTQLSIATEDSITASHLSRVLTGEHRAANHTLVTCRRLAEQALEELQMAILMADGL